MSPKEYSFPNFSERYPHEAHAHLVTNETVQKAFPELPSDKHKGQNGRLLVIAGSPLFHGSGALTTRAAGEVETAFGMKTNDWLYYCSTPENLNYMKHRYDAFLGITREMVGQYLESADVAVVGPGMMREPQEHFPETDHEAASTRDLTRLVLKSGKKAVLDAGSIQVIAPDELQGHSNVIITPHLGEMHRLFGVDTAQFQTHHTDTFSDIASIATAVADIAASLDITILLKGPIDIAANKTGWVFSPGGTAELARGGTGDVLAGIIAALYTRVDDPLIAAGAGSYLLKRTGEFLTTKYAGVFDATDVASNASGIIHALQSAIAEATTASQPQSHR
jgi:ADP-dependent NAD(P)H-hydrate dehydratase / NAD(P)H-hydrate epimerase